MATEATTAAEAREKLVEEMKAKAEKVNSSRTGKGTRIRVGQTRGKNPQIVTWEAFDDSKPETCPASTEEFMTLTGKSDDKTLTALLIDGFNSAAYTAASDPIAEYVEATWPDDMQARFRLVVRNFAAGANVSIEDAVGVIKPSFVAGLAKMEAEAK